jgi:hypothetical protein
MDPAAVQDAGSHLGERLWEDYRVCPAGLERVGFVSALPFDVTSLAIPKRSRSGSRLATYEPDSPL